MLTELLPKMGINRHFPRKVLHSDTKYGGCSIPHLYMEQGAIAIKYIIQQIRRKTELGRIMQISMKTLQLEVGTNTQILMGTALPPTYITETWITKVWQHIIENNFELKIKVVKFYKIQREYDSCIMDKMKGFAGNVLRCINHCRMYSRIIFISDIATPNGLAVEDRYMDGRAKANSKYIWPKQGPPTEREWIIWRWALRKRVCTRDKRIIRNLGKWTAQSHIQYENIWHKEERKLLCRREGTWYEHHNTEYMKFCCRGKQKTKVPPECVPVHIVRTKTGIEILQRRWRERTKVKDDGNMSLTRGKKMENCQRIAFEDYIKPKDEGNKILEKFNNGELMAGSDGSLKLGRGACAWCIGDPTSENSIQGKYLCPGICQDMSSLRTELYGAMGIMLGMKMIIGHLKIASKSKMRIYIDNNEVIERMKKWREYNKYDVLRPEYEIEEIIISECWNILPQCEWLWIKGHNKSNMTPAGRLNEKMDRDENKKRRRQILSHKMKHRRTILLQ